MFPFQTRTALTQSYTGRLLHPLATASETVATYTQKLPQNNLSANSQQTSLVPRITNTMNTQSELL